MAWDVPNFSLSGQPGISSNWADGILDARNDKRQRVQGEQMLAGREAALQQARNPDGSIDWSRASQALLGNGDIDGAKYAGGMADNASDDSWRRERATQEDNQWAKSYSLAQSNAARSGEFNLGPGEIRYKANGEVLAQGRPKRRDLPSGFQEGPNGLEPIPGGPADPDYLRSKPDRANAPPGYVWTDPNDPGKGLSAIPGGPAEKITPETAARIGLADSFTRDLNDEVGPDGKVTRPGIRSEVKGGGATGPLDYLAGSKGIGPQGRIHARIKSGSEALLRNLTGAGMNMTEAQEYAKRYEPTMYDTADTLTQKLDQLERELTSVNEVVGRGRGGVRSPNGAPAPGGTTSGGVKWSIEP